MDNNGVSQKKQYKGENKELIRELGLVIQRFSNFSRFWSVSAFSVLSLSLTLGVVYLKVSDKVCLKILILIIFLATVVLSNLMAINYLALEKSARNQYNKIKSGHQKNIEWKKVKVKPNFKKAFKSWAIMIPLFLYLIYFISLTLLLFWN